MQQQVAFVGMDLGTFKTSVIASNGRRAVLQSAVGWPKDHIAREMLGRAIIFGDETEEHAMALDSVRPFASGALKYISESDAGLSAEVTKKRRTAARLLVEHAVSLLQLPQGTRVYGIIGAPSRANVDNKQCILEAARTAFDTAMIVPEPFAVAYGMDRLNGAMIVDIGAGTTDVCPVYGAYPAEEDQVTLPLGGEAIDAELCRRVAEMYPEARMSLRIARQIKEKHGRVNDSADPVKVSLYNKGTPQEFDITAAMKESCRLIVRPIVDAIREVISRFDGEYHEAILQNVLLAGGGSGLRGLASVIERELAALGGGKVTRAYDTVFAGAAGALKLAINMPAEQWEKMRRLDSEPLAAAA